MAMVHAENGCCKVYLERTLKGQGRVSARYHLESAPNLLEAEAVNRAATMALITRCPLYPVHLSAAEVLPILEQYRQRGLTLYGETCPHYLTLTNDDLLAKGYLLKVSPPLRQREDREAMWRGVAQGSLNTIGSDFTGYTRTLKLTNRLEGPAIEPALGTENIFDIAAGLSTLEFMMPVVWSYGVNRGRITIPRFVQLFCENPAKIFGIFPRKGSLQPGADADLVIWDPARQHVVEEEHGKSDLGTFRGMQLLGMPVMTMVRGAIVVQEGTLVGSRGAGRFVPRDVNRAAYAPGGPSIL
jgi:dihydropyrimidinase